MIPHELELKDNTNGICIQNKHVTDIEKQTDGYQRGTGGGDRGRSMGLTDTKCYKEKKQGFTI